MVLFDNIFCGQRVEVRWDNGIHKGTVRFKGCIATKRGEWVGVALDHAVGDTSGMLFGRRYFQCKPGYGVFVRSDRIRFVSSTRCLYDKYHKVANKSFIEEHLFDKPRPEIKNGPYDPIAVSPRDLTRVRSSLGDYSSSNSGLWDKPIQYNLRHSISNFIPAATMLRAETAARPFRSHYSRPVHADYWIDDDFERRPSIPKTHMPHQALEQQVRRGWQGAHYTREMSVPSGRDRMKSIQWNDVSA